MSARLTLDLGDWEAALNELMVRAQDERWAERLFDRDTTLWTEDPDVAATIADRLGWLDAPAHFAVQAAALEGFGDGVRETGFDTAVVMGMGGSSLAPDVFHRTFGPTEDYLDLRILDSTDPAAVSAVVDDLDPLETLWIVASKSGTTTEPLAFLADAWSRVEAELEGRGSDQRPGEFFAAITDPEKSLDAIPHHDELRERFLNPPDVGGRYAALTYVGLVPASLIGIDIDSLLAAGAEMLAACREPGVRANPGLLLGLVIGGLARDGRDKLTFLADPAIASFGAWAEQLIAESTGKHGVGIVPVDLEPLREAAGYGSDRAFVHLSLVDGDGAARRDRKRLLDELRSAGHPVIEIELDDPIDLAGEMARWEVATAFAGAVLGIDPFDQPNVEDAKERTRRVLAGAGSGDAEALGRRRGGGRDPRRSARRRQSRRAPAPDAQGPRHPGLRLHPGVHRALARGRRRDRPNPHGTRAIGLRDDGGLRPALPPLDRAAPQGRPTDGGLPAAHLGASGRSADPGLAVHVRTADRCAGARRPRGAARA